MVKVLYRRPLSRFLCLATLATTLTFSSIGYAQSNNGISDTRQIRAEVPGDRWMEIDLYWFEPTDIPGSVDRFWDRFYPLFDGVAGDRGVILNVGWTVGYIMEWSGD